MTTTPNLYAYEPARALTLEDEVALHLLRRYTSGPVGDHLAEAYDDADLFLRAAARRQAGLPLRGDTRHDKETRADLRSVIEHHQERLRREELALGVTRADAVVAAPWLAYANELSELMHEALRKAQREGLVSVDLRAPVGRGKTTAARFLVAWELYRFHRWHDHVLPPGDTLAIVSDNPYLLDRCRHDYLQTAASGVYGGTARAVVFLSPEEEGALSANVLCAVFDNAPRPSREKFLATLVPLADRVKARFAPYCGLVATTDGAKYPEARTLDLWSSREDEKPLPAGLTVPKLEPLPE